MDDAAIEHQFAVVNRIPRITDGIPVSFDNENFTGKQIRRAYLGNPLVYIDIIEDKIYVVGLSERRISDTDAFRLRWKP